LVLQRVVLGLVVVLIIQHCSDDESLEKEIVQGYQGTETGVDNAAVA